MSRTRFVLVVALVAGAVFCGLSVALRVDAGGVGSAARPEGRGSVDLGVRVDRPLPRVHLVDAAGRSITLNSFRGKWVVLVPSMTLCHEVCPLTTAALERLERLIAAGGAAHRVIAVEVSVDPWRDTPRRLRAYRRLTGADFPLLTGDLRSLHRLWSFLGVNFKKVPQGDPPDDDWMTGKPERFDVEHTDGAFVIGPDGRERLAIAGMPAVGGHLKGSLARLLNAEGNENLHRPAPGWSAVALARRLEQMMGAPRRPAGDPSRAPGGELRTGESLAEGLAAARGRIALVNVWASWCPPCREEMPLLAAAERRFGDRVAFLGADLEDDAESARTSLRGAGADYPSYAVDSAEVDGLLGPVAGTPVTFFVDESGAVVDQHIGAYSSTAELDDDLLRHLHE